MPGPTWFTWETGSFLMSRLANFRALTTRETKTLLILNMNRDGESLLILKSCFLASLPLSFSTTPLQDLLLQESNLSFRQNCCMLLILLPEPNLALMLIRLFGYTVAQFHGKLVLIPLYPSFLFAFAFSIFSLVFFFSCMEK